VNILHNNTGTKTFTYDANGNTAVINAAGSLTTNTWDIENRLTVVQLPAGGRTTATYDGDGKRRAYEDSVMLRNFIWDGENIVRQTDSNNVTCRSYTLRPELFGELISQDGPTFHHYDALGSTMLLTDASQNTVISYLYRAFGEQTVLSGSNPNRFTWVGRLGYYRQPDTGDYWIRARVYRPSIGRWVSRDLESDTVDRNGVYSYARNPIRGADPSGASFVDDLQRVLELIERLRSHLANLACAYNVWRFIATRFHGIMPKKCGYSTWDKFAHCLASCMADRRCGTISSAAIGILKELKDMVQGWSKNAIDALPLPKWLKEWLKGRTGTATKWDWWDILSNVHGLACAREDPRCCNCIKCCCRLCP